MSKKKKEKCEKTMPLTKLERLRSFKEEQYKNLIEDYDASRENLLYMRAVIEEALSKLENNLTKEKDKKASAKVNAISTAIYASMQINDQIMKLHERFDELIENVVPDDIITLVDQKEEKTEQKTTSVLKAIDPLAKAKRA
jgi:hypothetical protein